MIYSTITTHRDLHVQLLCLYCTCVCLHVQCMWHTPEIYRMLDNVRQYHTVYHNYFMVCVTQLLTYQDSTSLVNMPARLLPHICTCTCNCLHLVCQILVTPTHIKVPPPVDSVLPPYTPSSFPLTKGTSHPSMTQGDMLNQLKRDRTHYKSSSAGIVRSVGSIMAASYQLDAGRFLYWGINLLSLWRGL